MSSHLPRRTRRSHNTFFELCLIIVPCAATVAQDAKSFEPHVLDDQSPQISEYVRKVFQDREGSFWFGTNGDGVCRYDGKSLKYFSVEQGLSGSAIRGILQDEDGAMWFATDGGVSRYKDGVFTNYSVVYSLGDNGVWSMMRDRSGVIWVGTEAGVYRFDGTSFVPFPIPRAAVENPVSRFNPTVVWGMAEDREGNIWFGTDGEGARKYDGKSFTTYTTKNGLAGDNVRCVYVDRRGHVWLGTEGFGVSRYDGTSFTHFTKKDGLNNDRIFGVLEDKAGDLWFSTLGAGACRYDGKSFTAYDESKGLTRTHVQSMFEDREGRLWFGCSGGLFRFDGKSFINVRRSGPWPPPPQDAAPAAVSGPMANFARMIGQWQVTFASGQVASHAWLWGPGKHSMRKMAYMSDGNGNPWAGEVMYWHPGLKRVRVLSLHEDIPAVGRGVAEGTIKFEGESTDSLFDLYQPRGPRKLGGRQIFDGPDKYREILLEDSGAGLQPLNEWNFVRTQDRAGLTAPAAERPPAKLPGYLKGFELMLGHVWKSTGENKGDMAPRHALKLQTTFEWIESLEVIYARVMESTGKGEPTTLLEAYVYHHVGTNLLRCLALSHRGDVYEGDVSVLDDGALQFDLKGYEGEVVIPLVVRIDFEKDGTLRHRVWSHKDTERSLMLDVHYNKLEPKND